jgi:tRNA A-37 threonylcarbamoyl transferase component Bud32
MRRYEVLNTANGQVLSSAADEGAALRSVRELLTGGTPADTLVLTVVEADERRPLVEGAALAALVGEGGQLLGGQFRLIRPLGQGGMATVYLADQPSLQRQVAIKMVVRRKDADAEQFQTEAATLAQVRHPNILAIYDYVEVGNAAYIAMEYVPGGSLRDLLRDDPRPPLDYTVEVIRQVAGALDAAHRLGIVHRDVKPANVALLEQRPDRPTISGSGIGTPAYMSPEQALDHSVDHRADVYSLGVMAFQMVTGKLPFEAETALAMAMQHIHSPVPRMPVSLAVPAGIETAVRRAMAKDPAQRFSTAGAFARALLAAMPTKRSRAVRLALSAGLVAAIVALVGGVATAYLVGSGPLAAGGVAFFSRGTTVTDPAIVEDYRQFLIAANGAWTAAVGFNGSQALLEEYFVAPRLDDIRNAVADLRRRNEYRAAALLDLQVRSVRFTSQDEAIVQTEERWDDRLHGADGAIIRAFPAEAAVTYLLVRTPVGWRIRGVVGKPL